jgi:hypothetical protein
MDTLRNPLVIAGGVGLGLILLLTNRSGAPAATGMEAYAVAAAGAATEQARLAVISNQTRAEFDSRNYAEQQGTLRLRLETEAQVAMQRNEMTAGIVNNIVNTSAQRSIAIVEANERINARTLQYLTDMGDQKTQVTLANIAARDAKKARQSQLYSSVISGIGSMFAGPTAAVTSAIGNRVAESVWRTPPINAQPTPPLPAVSGWI